MTVPDGFTVQLVASEPQLRQPVAIDFDNRGRLWAIQYLQYPNPAGLKRVKVDRFSRTVYDRIPEPPPRGPKGADRLTIFEDTDGDGRVDRAKDFVKDLNLASGFAFGYGGVFVLQAPYLLFYPDRDGNDVPDSDPDVCLTGFGMEDAHSVANSLTFGPDGWLYGCQGSTVTASIRGIEFQQGVWRYHPISRKFELFCEGGGNSWGLDFDANGQLLYSTNVGGHVMLHGVQGAYYWKSFGKHGALHNPYAYGYFDHVPHAGFRGGHVTVGGMVYQGTSFPASFRGKYIAADLLGHAVYWNEVGPNGSTFRSRFGGVLLRANDTWFAPSDLTIGPDGAVYVADWHDQRMAHPDPDAEWDRRNGRVYRIAAKGTKPFVSIELHKRSSMELAHMLGDANDWLVRRVRMELAERRDPEVIFPLRTLVMENENDRLALQALWALNVSGGINEEFAVKTLSHRFPAIREWSVRWLGDEERVSTETSQRLLDLAKSERDVRVIAQLAATAKRLPAEQALRIIRALAGRDDLPDDPFLPNLVWWALERHAIAAREQVVAQFAVSALNQPAPVRRDLIDRLIRRFASEGSHAGDNACLRLVLRASNSNWSALNQGLKDRPRNAMSRDLRTTLVSGLKWCPSSALAAEMLMRIGDPAAEEAVVRNLADPATRAWALRLLNELGSPGTVPVLLHYTDDVETLRALRRFDDPNIANKLIGDWPRHNASWRSVASETLASRKSWAIALLRAVDLGHINPKEIPVESIRSLANFKDRDIDALVRKHWGELKSSTPEEKLAEVRRFNNDLRAGEGDAKRGREIFRKACANCHQLFGEGEKTGPDLTHANRKDRDYLLISIVDPSAIVRKEYLSYAIQTKDGRSLTGLIAEQSPAHVTMLNAKNERIRIERNRIESIEESPASIMPEDLLKPLKPQELRDLFRYLQSERAP